MNQSSSASQYVNDLENNQLSDYSFYKSTYHSLLRDANLLLWVGIIVDPKTDIIIDCKWHSTNHLEFKDELINLSNHIVGLTFESLQSIKFKSTQLKQLFSRMSSSI